VVSLDGESLHPDALKRLRCRRRDPTTPLRLGEIPYEETVNFDNPNMDFVYMIIGTLSADYMIFDVRRVRQSLGAKAASSSFVDLLPDSLKSMLKDESVIKVGADLDL
jgi:hypothetical protein